MNASRLHRGLLRFARDRRAGSGLLFAILAPIMIGATALSIDVSMFYTKKRKLQSAVDMAALASATTPTSSDSAARQSLSDNDVAFVNLATNTGRYDATALLGARYTAGAAPSNAVSVTASVTTPMMFGRIYNMMGQTGITSQVTISATGAAAATPSAAFGIGARLVSLNGGIANAVLSGLLGTTVSLSAVDYDSLASASIDVDAYLQSVAATIGAQSGNKVDVLGASIPLSTALGALSNAGLDSRTAAAVQDLLNALPRTTGNVSLNGLVNLGSYGTLPVGTALPVKVSMNAYDIVAGLIGLAASGRPLSVGLGAAVPGILSASLTMNVGTDAPSSAVAPYATVTTAVTRQISLKLVTTANVLGIGTVQLPLVITIASAKATTQGPVCSGGAATLNLAVTPSAVDLTIGSAAGTAGPIATLLGLSVSGYAHAAIAAMSPTTETFATRDVAAKTVQTTATTSVIASLLSTALGGLQLSVGGLPLPIFIPPSLTSLLTNGLLTLAVPTDTLLDSVTRALGVGIGEADTWVTDLKCGAPMLIQ